MENETTEITSTQPVETSVEAVQPETTVDTQQVEPVEAPVEVSEETQVAPEVESEISVDPVVITDLIFEGHNLSVVVPEEAVKMCQEKGFDAAELAKELYSSEDFTLSKETREKLDAAYGKFFVDSIIGGLRADQTRIIAEYKANEQKAFDAIADIVGGDEGWAAMEQFASTLPEEEIAAFNEAMASGNPYFQKLAAKDMATRMRGDEPQPVAAEPSLNLIEGTNKVEAAPTHMSFEEYRAILRTEEYKANPAYYDNLRRKGQQMGI